jgi:predicted RNA binding protein YcfA (HicA-like mRNA interferase family)
MSIVPSLTAQDTVRALKKLGFEEDRQKGSHLVLFNSKTNARTVVPMHSGKTIKKGLLHQIIKDAQVSVQEFITNL